MTTERYPAGTAVSTVGISGDASLTLRSVLIGALLSAGIGVAEPVGVMMVEGSPLAADFSTGWAVFILFLLTLVVNTFLKMLSPRSALSTAELVVIYIMMVVACAVPSWGFTMNLAFVITGVYYYAPLSWVDSIHPYLREWFVVREPQAIEYFFEKLPEGKAIPWSAWLTPLLCWGTFILAVYFVMLCVAVVLRKQWADREHLSYPLVQLPEEMVKSESPLPPLMRNGVMWLGFALPALVYSVNALSNYFPSVPRVNLRFGFPIFHRAEYVYMRVFFEVIGLTYLLPAEISLSLWLFAFLVTVESGIFRSVGFDFGPYIAYSSSGQPIAFQGLGAMIALVGGFLWVARSHIRDVLVKAIKGSKNIDDSGEALSYRTCVLGIVFGSIFIGLWLNASGLTPLSTVAYMFFAFVVFAGLTRIVCQAGLAYGRACFFPGAATVYTVGTSNLGHSGLTALGLTFAWAADVRTTVMTSASNALKLCDLTRLKGRRIGLALMLGAFACLTSSMGAVVLLSYKYGAVNLGGWQAKGLGRYTWRWVESFISTPVELKTGQLCFMGIGGGLMLALGLIRARFFWFPIHPIGLALGLAGPFRWVWFSVLIGWVAKSLTAKLGGGGLYRRTRPFFLGLILGSFATAGLWLLIDFCTGMRGNIFTLN